MGVVMFEGDARLVVCWSEELMKRDSSLQRLEQFSLGLKRE
jgi:hypothetical protein